MIRRNGSFYARTAVGLAGGLLLAGLGSAAFAAELGNDGVDVNVEIGENPAGSLSLSVAADSTSLTEVEGASADYREFTGALPDVTVTDTRAVVPEGVSWAVTGQASDFVGTDGQAPITPDHLGWKPAMETADDTGNVFEGEEVSTSLDEATPEVDNVGLAGQELLQMTLDSADAQGENGTWTANAGLTLKTPNNVEPGSYSSTLTLSLFEEAYE